MALPGLEKFSHLEDKIYRTSEVFKSLLQQRDQLQQEVTNLREEVQNLNIENARLSLQVEQLGSEREEIRAKVESMLSAISVIDLELADLEEEVEEAVQQ
jgi:chromosome segregation ATPase